MFAAAANDPGFAEFAEAHPDAYRLVYNGRTIEGDTTLCDLGVGAGDCGRLSCLLKLRGGGRPHVSVCVYTCVRVCVCVCVCACVCVSVYMYIHTHAHIYLYVHTYL